MSWTSVESSNLTHETVTVQTNPVGNTRFPYRSLATVLLTSFALGCVLMVGLLQQCHVLLDLVGETLPDRDLLALALALAGVGLIVAMPVQISYLVERVRQQRPAVVEQTAARVRRFDPCNAVAETDVRAQPARTAEESVQLGVRNHSNGGALATSRCACV